MLTLIHGSYNNSTTALSARYTYTLNDMNLVNKQTGDAAGREALCLSFAHYGVATRIFSNFKLTD